MKITSYVSKDLYESIVLRSQALGVSQSEYLRMLVTLDIAIQKYLDVSPKLNNLHNKIVGMQDKLGMYPPILMDPITYE